MFRAAAVAPGSAEVIKRLSDEYAFSRVFRLDWCEEPVANSDSKLDIRGHCAS